jgi:hypothetical protein
MDPSILRFAQMAGIFVTTCAALGERSQESSRLLP